MSGLSPDRIFDRISDIDIWGDLLGQGLDCALLDIDNTVRSRADGQVPADVREWLDKARAAGVKLCLLSNNFHGDTPVLGEQLGIPCVHRAMKPLPFGYFAAMQRVGAQSSKTVIIGDQLLTDIVGGRVLGIRAYLVAPLATKDLAHTRALRKIEAGILGHSGESLRSPAFRKSEDSSNGIIF